MRGIKIRTDTLVCGVRRLEILIEVLDELGESFPLLGLLCGVLEPLASVLFFLSFLERFIAFADAFEAGFANR